MREYDANGNPVRDIDFTSPTFPRAGSVPIAQDHHINTVSTSTTPRSAVVLALSEIILKF
ncbi:MAG: hypothetical protein GDA56_02965 [Hormoscilla sp. GM7CHS1pb]|nr:hypothetical protein [Hormoscilla sp. GM7CHS1pb]